MYRQIPSTFTINTSNTPQPLFGSWVTAGAGFTQPAGAPLTLTLGTALASGNDASMFQPGEPAWLIDPNGAHAETVRIQSISANTVTLGNQTDSSYQGVNPVTRFAHAVGALGTGTFIMPKIECNNFLVDLEDGGAGAFLYIGCQYNMTATAYRIYKLAKTTAGNQPFYYSSAMYSPGNPVSIYQLFVMGTNPDAYCLSLEIA
ncbi:MAG TPA: hypothetical protein VN861_03225 [Candidatus Acidoferrales bacterium]|nr:hypothetical protein [Candidatus Acidoferrales bacterium]